MKVWVLEYINPESDDDGAQSVLIGVFTSAERAKTFPDVARLRWVASPQDDEWFCLVTPVTDGGEHTRLYRIFSTPLLGSEYYQTIEGAVEVSAIDGATQYGVFSDDDPNGAAALCLNDILRPLEWKRVRVTVEVVDG